MPLILRVYNIVSGLSADFTGRPHDSHLLPTLILNSFSYGCIITLAVLTWLGDRFTNEVKRIEKQASMNS